jgi:cell division protease FtsH
VVFEMYTTGAENDMQQATELARQMVTRWGMSERLGPVTLAPREGIAGSGLEGFGMAGKPYGAAMADAIDAEVQRLLKEAADEARRLLEAHRHELDGLAAALLEHETLDEPAIRRATGLLAIPRVAPLPLRPAVANTNGRRT